MFVDAFSTAILNACRILDTFLPEVLLHCAPTMRLFPVLLKGYWSSRAGELTLSWQCGCDDCCPI
jgi:hypothetical protein